MKKILCILMSMMMLLSSTAFVRGASLLAGESTHSTVFHHRNSLKTNIANSRTAVLLNASETDEQELEQQELAQEDFCPQFLAQFYLFQLLNKGSSSNPFVKSQHLELLSYTPVYILFHSIRLYSC
ncbi:hypothetical protein [Ornithobacterium rhinotracheale]|nr:hypothetical protein [Ornithobacterium rhinotracheale]AIQ00611.1 hypothetical protein Q785_08325 [Ornithobacterium rhinotracheale ORT-UMN 88]KGB66191.1 hypothetical protein Q787_08135 [Ornithobacterium rhinotracheale H06-030791]MBN3661529.1 hypothetical protein [Ornithobacterium rhinotracheale]MCK0193855.1 hypothetical protein [Ornithobacterium rhinotracheale]MCK0203012.1 hypothetical protein [Ornithobacterium rhinotracheale]